ncbi:meckelin-like [Macrosteles quadrilineatus]|uniref:meckelin-like n=1 Tax=Macrosteles quadrilineatus TaxID=74068 RepID=UPI0023E0CFE5|nr:meckelin-like [Macrosteles quadrilineatus]
MTYTELKIISVYFVLSTLNLFLTVETYSSELIQFPNNSFCNKSDYFSVNNLKCVHCGSTKNLVPATNKLACVCNSLSYQVKWGKEDYPNCIPCGADKVATKDGRFCISCSSETLNSTIKNALNASGCANCSSDEILVERDTNGTLLPQQRCVRCVQGTRPSADGTVCTPCFTLNISGNGSCSCPSGTHEQLSRDVCVPHSELTNWPDDSATYTIDYPLSGKSVQSAHLKTHLRRDIYLCKSQRRSSACQSVANMCVLTHYRDGPVCSLFRDFKHIPSSDKEPYPWLYYGDGDAPTVLNRRKISTRYSLHPYSELSLINLTAVKWQVNGSYGGVVRFVGSSLQLCPGDWVSQDAALRFGSRYAQQCSLRPSQLMSSQLRNQLIDLYLQFDSYLYALPVLDTSFQQGNRFPNKESDMGQWQLTRRFFLIDSVSGVPVNGNKVEVIQYLKSATLRVRAQHGEDQGKIYPPVLTLSYSGITAQHIQSDTPVQISFYVDFYKDSRVTYTIDIWLGVLCGLAVVWSALQTWSYSKRSAHLVIDLLTLCHLCIICAGHLANVFFAVVSLAAVHNFVYYKGQAVAQVLLPSTALDSYVYTYVIVAYSLKLVEVGHMVWQQTTVDIFLIDWERPRATSNKQSQPVSIWRTYFVANEWNEIQSSRKTSLTVQLVSVVLLIKVFGMENWSISDPDINSVATPEMKYRPANFTFQFAVAFLVFVFVYIVQWLMLSAVYERYVKDGIQEFVDVCSLANISVFILTLENFGYYIHGRSAHGFSDTDMQTIMNQLRREEEDLVGHRGLLPASDHQTFQMYIPNQLRSYYHRLMPPAPVTKQIPSAVTSALRLKLTGVSSADFDRSVTAYHNMNKFLAAFLEHALRDLDYEVRDKLFAEALLDIEFSDTPGKAVFYIDNGHSFDKVLFYGNESTLFSMDLMGFCFFQVITGDFLLAAIITALLAKVLMVIRHIGGRRNLAKKTLIDERFLI